MGPPYNQGRGGTGWESGQMLTLFSHADWSDFCLAHLFAFQKFTDGLVGVAYPAAPGDFPGGICTEGGWKINIRNVWMKFLFSLQLVEISMVETLLLLMLGCRRTKGTEGVSCC